MSDASPSSKTTQVLSVRVSPRERDLLAHAAEQGRTSLSDFVRSRAVEAAEIDFLGRQVIAIPAADWERFEAWVKAPARDVPELRDLVAGGPERRD